MNVYSIEIMIVDHDKVGAAEITVILENTNYPNWCISPKVMKIKSKDIGEWSDDNPLNITHSADAEYDRIFSDTPTTGTSCISRFANFSCPKCGYGTPELYEGYCKDCRDERQRVLDQHNAQYDSWQKMTDAQREVAIKEARR